MGKLNVGILFGGCSPEYAVSLQSAAAVIVHLNQEKYRPVLIGISRAGEWFRYYGDAAAVAADAWLNQTDCVPALLSPCRKTHGLLEQTAAGLRATRLDVVFPVLHGQNGEDGTVQGLLELAGIPIAGCGALSSALCMDKELTKAVVAGLGIASARCVTLREGDDYEQSLARVANLPAPWFVKPARAGSSFGISRVATAARLGEALARAWQFDRKVVVEEAVAGFEVGCAVLGNEDLLVGELDEIELGTDFFDYHEKYTLETARIHLPARLAPALTAEVKRTAKRIYRALGCRGLARVDLFVTPKGGLVFNEVNTIPGFTAHSRYPNMLRGAGVDFHELVERVLALGLEQAA